jgi:hypothetical protein
MRSDEAWQCEPINDGGGNNSSVLLPHQGMAGVGTHRSLRDPRRGPEDASPGLPPGHLGTGKLWRAFFDGRLRMELALARLAGSFIGEEHVSQPCSVVTLGRPA